MDNEFLHQLSDNARDSLGIEKIEEMDAATHVLHNIFREHAELATLIALQYFISGNDLFQTLMTQFLSGTALYREMMIKHNVDVDAIEEKELKEQK